MTPDERRWLDDELAMIRRKVETTYNRVNERTGMLYNAIIAQNLDSTDVAEKVAEKILAAGAGGDVDRATVAAGVKDALDALGRLFLADDDIVE